jgi:hypothetical protein
MKKLVFTFSLSLCFFCIGLFLSFSLSAQQLQWAKQMGSTGADAGFATATDAAGNVYTTGYFSGTVDFDPGAGVSNLTALGNSRDAFIQKLDANGNFVWAKRIGGTGQDEARGIALDASGNIYLVGIFQGAVDFDPGPTVNVLFAPLGKIDSYALKLDNAGNFVWVKSIGLTLVNTYGVANADYNTSDIFLNDIDLDTNGNIFAVGYINFINLPTNTSLSIPFITKLSNVGNLINDSMLGDSNNNLDNSQIISIIIDKNNNNDVIFSGYFEGTKSFGASNYIATKKNIFAARISNDLTTLYWFNNLGGAGDDVATGLALDGTGALYVTGHFENTVDFDTNVGVANLTSTGGSDIFVAKYFAGTGNLVWARSIGGTENEEGGVVRFLNGKVYITSEFRGQMDINTDLLTSNGNTDIFLAKLDEVGNIAWVRSIGGTQKDKASDMSLSADGSIYLTGSFGNMVDFDPSKNTSNLTAVGGTDIFVSKIKEIPDTDSRVELPTAQVPAQSVSLDAVDVIAFQFKIADLGTADEFPTIANQLRILQGGGNTVANWEGKIVDAKLFEGVKQTNATATISTNQIIFSNLQVPKNTSKEFVLKISLAKTGLNDGDKFAFQIPATAHGTTANATESSQFAATFPATVTSNLITIDIGLPAPPTKEASLLWAKSAGGTGNDGANYIGVDALGNIYTTGYFTGTADFDPSAGVFNLTSQGGQDIFIQKVDKDGNLLWAKRIGGTSDDIANSLFVDALGNVYLTGAFQNTADFDPNVGVLNLSSQGGQDVFVLKLDTHGNLIWAKSMGGAGADVGNVITVDASGNVHTVGYFAETVDFDPNAGISNLDEFAGLGFGDIFIQKLDTNGNFIWAKSVGGIGSDRATCIIVDASGNVYNVGYFQVTADFDPSASDFSLTSNGLYGGFIQKLDVNGNFVWAKGLEGANFLDNSIGQSVAIDATGNVYVTGHFTGTVDFDPNAGTANFTSAGDDDIFIQKWDNNGNLIWVKRIGSASTDQAFALTLDTQNNVYISGQFSGTVDFDPNAGIANLVSAGGLDAFVLKLDESGNYIWAKKIGGTGNDYGTTVRIDANGNAHLTGYFSDTADFDPNLCISSLSSAGVSDIFITKLNTVYVDKDAFVATSPLQVPATSVGLGAVGVEVFKFVISDLGAFDCLPTLVNQVVIQQGAGNTVANWVGKITNAELFVGNTLVPTTVNITATTITFTISGTNLQILDKSNQEISLKISLASSGLANGDEFAFQIPANSHNFIANISGSTFATSFPNNVVSNIFTVTLSQDTDSRVNAPVTQIPAKNMTVGTSGEVFRFSIADLGTSDNLSTNTKQVKIQQGAGNTVANWSGKIISAKLLKSGVEVPANVSINATDITFTILNSDLSVQNNSSEEVTLNIVLANTGFVNGDKLVFQVPTATHGFIAEVGGSQFATNFPLAVVSNIITIERITDENSLVTIPTIQEPAQNQPMGMADLTVFKFNLQDLGTTDGLPTIVNQIYIQQGVGNTVTDWSAGISNAKLFLGATLIPATVSITAGDITFSGVNLTINNGSSQEITLKITLAASGFADGEKLAFQIPPVAHNLLASPTGSSQFANVLPNRVSSNILTIGTPLPDLIVTTAETHQGNYNNVTVKSTGELTLSGNMSSAGVFKIETGGKLFVGNCFIVTGSGSFVMEANTTLQVCSPDGITLTGTTGNIQLTGTRTYSEASYIYNGTAAQNTGNGLPATILNLTLNNASGATLTNNVGVKNLVDLQNGDLTSNGRLTVLSSATQTGMIVQKVDGSNVVTGTASVQRHVTGGQSVYPAAYTGVGGYHYFSSPLQNGTVAEFADNISIVLNPNYDFVIPYSGAFPNFYRYRENRVQASAPNDIFEKGWESPANTSEPLVPQRGYIANASVGTTIDFTGLLNNGNLNTTLSRGTSTQAGWNLMGNPYPAPISWTAVVGLNPNIEGQVLRRIPTGQYAGTWASFVNGVGQNGATDEIALAQGFFVRAIVNNAAFQMNNSVRLQNYNNPTFFRTEESESAKKTGLVKIGVKKDNLMDETAVYFEEGASEGFDFRYDGERTQLNSGGIPTVFSTSREGKRLAISGLPDFKEDYMIPVSVNFLSTGKYEFTLNELKYFRQNVQVYIEDKVKKVFHNLRQEEEYAFETTQVGFVQNRFVLHFTNKGTNAYESLSVFPNPSEGEEVNLSLFSEYKGDITINVYDMMGKLRKTYQTTKQDNSTIFRVDLSSLELGLYLIEVVEGMDRKTKKWKKG